MLLRIQNDTTTAVFPIVAIVLELTKLRVYDDKLKECVEFKGVKPGSIVDVYTDTGVHLTGVTMKAQEV